MTHEPHCQDFLKASEKALKDDQLQELLNRTLKSGFQKKRLMSMARLPEYDQLRDQARDVKNHILDHLDAYLERFELQVKKAGGHVHWAQDAEQAREIILKICQNAGAKTVTKGKSMIAEEIDLNDYLQDAGLVPIETDLGEYIIQLREELPSHIIAPAFHLSKTQVAETFKEHHTHLDPDRDMVEPTSLLKEARKELREKFIQADVGITGANFLIAETGTAMIVTNEGNGDLTQSLPRVHIALSSIEKVVPTLEDATLFLRLLARTATGQEQSVYNTFFTGPKRDGDLDGPEEFHMVLLDNRRTELLGSEFRDILRCIRCGACINHCPVYGVTSGHAYGWVYPGPMGSVLTPHFVGIKEAHLLPSACTMCGRCGEVCPVRIPLPDLLRNWRGHAFNAGKPGGLQRMGLKVWAWLAKRPTLYHAITPIKIWGMKLLAGKRGRFKSMIGAGGWTKTRDLPAPQGGTFQSRRQKGER
ncbi:LutB/LldF family L-lactate oxidation iron-sulfur protein [Magnetovibrio sp. PR-2]|uniref:LutB/LldF family L-lactate oxidation iron-sulfur protein n=1 Tax=Magnetovibrio sp. PR-2 TaxID=3120356 RepID=UPI002FCE2BE1